MQLPPIHFGLLFSIISFTVLVWAICWRIAPSGRERFLITGVFGGMCFYSGVGAAVGPPLFEYCWYYGAFVVAVAAGFLAVVRNDRPACGGAFARRVTDLGQSRTFRISVAAIYLGTAMVPLLYPEIRLSNIWNPPAPDLIAILNGGIPPEQPLLLRINTYIALLTWPFYLIALHAARRRYGWLAVGIILPVYLTYCATAYVGRSEMVMCTALFVGVVWLDQPTMRPRLALITAIFLPLLLIAFGAYSRIRLGAAMDRGVTATELIENVLLVESSLPRSWDELDRSRQHADLRAYFLWLLTLPVPKVVTGEMSKVRVNKDLSAIVTGIYPGDESYTITLCGPVLESIYIYGKGWFWIHGIFIGLVAGAMCLLIGRCQPLLVMFVQIALQFGYVFNRAGVGALIPPLMNAYLLFYALLFAWWCMGESVGHGRSGVPASAPVPVQG
jgi:hypothetical protein